MNIDAEQFDALPFEDKGSLLFSEGVYIGSRQYYKFNINLYSLYSYFVEAWYFNSSNTIERIASVRSAVKLSLYVPDTVLDELNDFLQ